MVIVSTIPLTICDHYARNEKAAITDKIIFCGFGIGLSLGVGIIDFENTEIFPVSTCTEFFSDDIDHLHNTKLPLNG